MNKNNEENPDQNLIQQITPNTTSAPAQSSVAKAFDTLAKAVNQTQTSQVFPSEPKNIQNLLSAMVIMLLFSFCFLGYQMQRKNNFSALFYGIIIIWFPYLNCINLLQRVMWILIHIMIMTFSFHSKSYARPTRESCVEFLPVRLWISFFSIGRFEIKKNNQPIDKKKKKIHRK